MNCDPCKSKHVENIKWLTSLHSGKVHSDQSPSMKEDLNWVHMLQCTSENQDEWKWWWAEGNP